MNRQEVFAMLKNRAIAYYDAYLSKKIKVKICSTYPLEYTCIRISDVWAIAPMFDCGLTEEYLLIHIPTGRRADWVSNRSIAIAYARELSEQPGWDTTDLTRLPNASGIQGKYQALDAALNPSVSNY
jgi:hypothetical protein